MDSVLKNYFICIIGILIVSCGNEAEKPSPDMVFGVDVGNDIKKDIADERGVNQPPIAVDDNPPAFYTNQKVVIDVLANDTDDKGIDPSSLRLGSEPLEGRVKIVAGKVEFTSLNHGDFSFSYDIADIEGERSKEATVQLKVLNTAPDFLSNATVIGVHDSEYSYLVQVNDPDPNDVLTISAPSLPPWLTLLQDTNETAILSGIPNAKEVGQAQEIIIVVSDSVNSTEQRFSISIDPSLADEKLESLSLNREAITLSANQKARFPKAQSGFQWNNGDDRTDNWRPQGIAEINTPNKTFVAVSWYGRGDYDTRGVRISFADVSDPNAVRYRHAILVDADLNFLSGVHAGGIVHKNGNLYVPDSRASHRVHVFPISSLTRVPSADLATFYNYGYYLKASSSFTTLVKPSFMSFDWSRNQFLFGAFTFAGDGPGTLEWSSEDSNFSKPFYEIMQGAASNNDRLWIARSYGRRNNSSVHYGNYKVGEDPNLSTFDSDVYPPGLEDMDVSPTSNRLWMLTEFGPHEGASNHRTVFFTNRDAFFP